LKNDRKKGHLKRKRAKKEGGVKRKGRGGNVL
jgi:hypothetical protein